VVERNGKKFHLQSFYVHHLKTHREGFLSLVQSDTKTDSSLFLTSTIADCTTTLTDAFMEASREAIVALSCFTSCWVLRKLDSKVLKRESSSWLRVWAMMMGKLEMEQAGLEIFAKK
jgi:hypothetical protein